MAGIKYFLFLAVFVLLSCKKDNGLSINGEWKYGGTQKLNDWNMVTAAYSPVTGTCLDDNYIIFGDNDKVVYKNGALKCSADEQDSYELEYKYYDGDTTMVINYTTYTIHEFSKKKLVLKLRVDPAAGYPGLAHLYYR